MRIGCAGARRDDGPGARRSEWWDLRRRNQPSARLLLSTRQGRPCRGRDRRFSKWKLRELLCDRMTHLPAFAKSLLLSHGDLQSTPDAFSIGNRPLRCSRPLYNVWERFRSPLRVAEPGRPGRERRDGVADHNFEGGVITARPAATPYFDTNCDARSTST